MRRVLKYSVPVSTGMQDLVVPYACKLLHVGAQSSSNDVIVWAQVDWPEDLVAKPETIAVKVTIVPTGGEPPAGFEYLGTALMLGGAFVWHLYADRNREALYTCQGLFT